MGQLRYKTCTNYMRQLWPCAAELGSESRFHRGAEGPSKRFCATVRRGWRKWREAWLLEGTRRSANKERQQPSI
jgi:hypothetical protein